MAKQLKTQKAQKNPSLHKAKLYQNRCEYCYLVDNEGRRQKAEGRRLFVFVTGIYTPLLGRVAHGGNPQDRTRPLQKLFALKGEVLAPIVLINKNYSQLILKQ